LNARKRITKKLREIIDYVNGIDKILHISMRGVASFYKLPNLVEALIELDCFEEKREISDNDYKELEDARDTAKFAETEIAEDFPLLHAHSVVALWSAAETFIDELAILWIMYERESIDKEILKKILIPLIEYEELDEKEKARLIYRAIEEKARSKYMPGIARYEKIMNIFGLGGSVEDSIKDDLYEMNNVRNIIVHSSAIADRQLVESCPRLNVKLGEKVKIKHSNYVRYKAAMSDYMIKIIYRIKDYYDKKENIEILMRK
jgi:uncharacterized protein YutE (UPF0331/DUF86 family)